MQEGGIRFKRGVLPLVVRVKEAAEAGHKRDRLLIYVKVFMDRATGSRPPFDRSSFFSARVSADYNGVKYE